MEEKVEEKIINIIKKKTNNECALHIDGGNVCSPDFLVEKMAKFIESKDVKVNNDSNKIVKNTKKILGCDSEICILKKPDFIKFAKVANVENIIKKNFKPEGPSDSTDWLSNFNIDDVLEQFVKKYPKRHFLHIPFQMRDFEKVGTELATTDLAYEFKNGYKTFGVVLNTDWSSGRGLHWFCLFGENKPDKIVLEYFNSSGNSPLPEIQAWLQKNKHHLTKELGKPTEIHYNTGIQFQNDEHSCGVYCLCYIWLRLEEIQPNEINTKNFTDKIMDDARKALFIDGGSSENTITF